MSKKEKNILLELLPNMVKYLIDNGGKSLISRNYGIFRIKCKGMSSIYLMLQKNNLKPRANNEI